jgi:hypothetical protein
MQGRRILGAALAVAALLAVPASARAAISATATGDDGNPAALSEAAPLALRNMDVQVNAHVDAADGLRWSLSVTGPDNVAAATPSSCNITQYTQDVRKYVTFRGNGAYTVLVQVFSDTACTKQTKQVVFQYAVGASVAIAQPGGPGLTRQPNSYATITQALGFTQNPGATTYDIQYAKGGVVGADGALSGPVQPAFLNRTTGNIEVGLREPGDYVFVARARNGDYYSPWSAPVTLRMVAPFDLLSVRAIDARGPSFKLRGTLREAYAAGGKVTVAMASGKKGKKFRTMGKAKINSKGVWTLRFTQRKYGYYRVRYSFSGNASVLKGAMYEVVRIRRVFG